MKRLNLYPYYEELLRMRIKTTTFRLTNRANYKEGEEVMLSIGWKEDEIIDLHSVRIRQVYQRRVSDLKELDFEGESPDCKTPETTRLVLSCVYRKVVSMDDTIWVIKFEHI